ncbi:MAG: nucleotidyltransferase family protein [Egibacteraceae bacterium]
MHPIIESNRAEIGALCKEPGIRRLDVFGSAVADEFDSEVSDVDVLVDFDTGSAGSFDTYFRLKEVWSGSSADRLTWSAPNSPDASRNSATSSASVNILPHGYAVVDDADG